MNDRAIMENLLLTTKGVCDLYMHGALESSTQPVHTAFDTALSEAICLQSNLYSKMSDKGWYPVEQAQQQQIDAVRQKFA